MKRIIKLFALILTLVFTTSLFAQDPPPPPPPGHGSSGNVPGGGAPMQRPANFGGTKRGLWREEGV